MTYDRTSNNRNCKIYDLESQIKKQIEILVYKLGKESNPILVEIAVTDFLVTVIREINKIITSFEYRLEMEDKKK
jgi:hypothetical protein